jgi:hypothetical protein
MTQMRNIICRIVLLHTYFHFYIDNVRKSLQTIHIYSLKLNYQKVKRQGICCNFCAQYQILKCGTTQAFAGQPEGRYDYILPE